MFFIVFYYSHILKSDPYKEYKYFFPLCAVAVRKQRKPVHVRERIMQLMQHHYNRRSLTYDCSYCTRTYPRGVILYRHLIYECLGAPVIRNQICPYCNFVARSKRTLVVHMAGKHKPQLEV